MIFIRFFIFLSAFVLVSAQAYANIYFWQDPKTKLSLTVPDSWQLAIDQKPNDVVTFLAPSGSDDARCRVRVNEDGRFKYYPRRFADEIMRTEYDRGFWQDYIAEFDAAVIHGVFVNNGLGRGHATMADFSFIPDVGPQIEKRGLAFVSHYNDKIYVAECSVKRTNFNQWYIDFMQVMKSVDFRKEIHELPSSDYRPFMRDSLLRVHGTRKMDSRLY